ncbi:MAG: 2-oxoglutarate dehydrogenase E1 component [Saprospiraceae bacterium]|nr:2-oxoglutarate dehydrogenase E1 component [Saprospiraceae bacterium]
MDQFSYIANAHPNFIEGLYEDFKKDKNLVEPQWKSFFEGFEFASASFDEPVATNGKTAPTSGWSADEFKVYALIEDYRKKAHLLSDTNPIRQRKDRKPHLSLQDFGLSNSDLTKRFQIGSAIGKANGSLQEIIDQLNLIYVGKIGIEYTYIESPEELRWIQQKFEDPNRINFSLDEKKRILTKLNETAVFENFLNKKYVGQKRFSLEGGESTIPAIDSIITKSAELGVEEVIIGMAHRGRLNVLTNVMGKTYEHIFNEFEGQADPDLTMGDGDVKYHLGYSSQLDTPSGKTVYLKLVPNPSHLECVNPVVEGFSRAKADVLYESNYDKILPILIHGDAAVAGQGVVYETVQMGGLPGYYTGGTIHYVINNQIGFTTNFDDARTSTYSTGVAALVKAPVFHVNGDDVESVVFVAQMAAEYRQKFNKDVFIDMVCYRKHGHNEGDDPKYTQPQMYKRIKDHPDPREIYVKKLTTGGEIDVQLAESMEKEFWAMLQDRLDLVKEKPLPYQYQSPELEWRRLQKNVRTEDAFPSPKTGISAKRVKEISDIILEIPDGFTPLRKVNKLLANQRKLIQEDKKIDWAAGELLAYSSILAEGNHVRISGQDVKRGTFSHRHSVLFDENTAQGHNRLNKVGGEETRFMIFNSFLSEFAVMGFEYGYSLASPSSLVIWEGQFGDFVNGAQTIIDQFLSAGESKWQRMSGLVLLLPHGYEGQGPEHSSARLERFLQNSAEYNWSVVNITTPANFFHAIRRQQKRNFRKPLIVMSPKSLLRHPKVISPISEITKGNFQEILDDPIASKAPKKVKRILFCSGKIYYDLLERQEAENRSDVAIVRLEQLYPLYFDGMDAIFKKYSNAKPYWVQEEPANMGAWTYMLSCYRKVDWTGISRKASASPATGYKKVHEAQQKDIVDRAFK